MHLVAGACVLNSTAWLSDSAQLAAAATHVLHVGNGALAQHTTLSKLHTWAPLHETDRHVYCQVTCVKLPVSLE
jgi:hypothetical protein